LLCLQAQQGEKLLQVHEALRLGAFLVGQLLARILLIEERLQAGGNWCRETEPCQIVWKVHFDR
jgi:hypothetical protein